MLASSAKRHAPSRAFCDQPTFFTGPAGLTNLVLLPGTQLEADDDDDVLVLPPLLPPPQAARIILTSEMTAMLVKNDRLSGVRENCIKNQPFKYKTTLSDMQSEPFCG